MRLTPCTRALVTATLLLLPSISTAQSPGTIVLDSATIASSGARTLADLLAARVPGISVTYLSGVPGAAAQVSARSSVGFSGSGRPALIVDGVLLRDDQLWVQPLSEVQPLADHWNLPTEEILKLEVVLGASDGTDLELGASRGAVLVTTHRPRGGVWSTHTFADVRSVAAGPAIRPPTTRTGDLPGGGTTYYCTLQAEAAGDCAPTGAWSHTPFPGGNPFQASQLVRGGISAAGGLPLGLQGRVAVTSASEPGALGAPIARHDAAIALTLPQRGRFSSSADFRLQWLDGDRIDYSMLRRSASYGPTDADISQDPDPERFEDFVRARAPGWRSQRTSVGSRTKVDLSSSTFVAVQLGAERLANFSDESFRETHPLFGPGVYRSDLNSERDTWAVAISARDSRRIGRAQLLSELSLTRTFSEQDDSSATNFLPDYGGTFPQFSSLARSETKTGTQRLAFSLRDESGFGVGAGVRREGFIDGAARFVPFADAHWHWTPRRSGLVSRLQLRAAYAEALDAQSSIDAFMRNAVVPNANIGPERTRERQLAADIHLVDGTFVIFGRAFDRKVEDAVTYAPDPGMFGSYRLMAGGEIRSRGGEIGIHAQRQLGARLRLASSLWLAGAVSEYGDLLPEQEAELFSDGLPPSVAMPVRSGERVGDVRNYRRDFSDANLDGVISASELGAFTPAERASLVPLRTMGATVSMVLGRLSIGTTLDGKFGHSRAGRDGGLCTARRCDARYDPETSLQDQAEALYFFEPLVDADFVRMRELWLSWRGGAGRLGEIELSLVGQHLLTWAASDSDDPESGVPYAPGMALGQYQQPVAPSIGLRIHIRGIGVRAPR